MNIEEDIESGKQKFVYLATTTWLYILWYNLQLDEDPNEDENEKLEEKAKRESKQIVGNIEKELIYPKYTEECKSDDKQRAKDIQERLEQLLSTTMVYCYFD